jgi:hypothetical protein
VEKNPAHIEGSLYRMFHQHSPSAATSDRLCKAF